MKHITPTPCFMFLNLMVWAKGCLNLPGEHCGNCFDLATPEGLALFLHEIYHIYQFYRNPFKMIWGYVRSLHDSIVFAKILFSHRHIPFEIEAITFEMELLLRLNKFPWSDSLKIFDLYR